MLTERYFDVLIALLQRIQREQKDDLLAGARMMAEAVKRGGSLFAFGCGHSSLIIQDVFYRAGGFMLINPIFGPGLQLDVRPVTLTSALERMEGYAQRLFEASGATRGDVLIIVSTSGRNVVPVEMAMAAKNGGVKVIAVTSRAYTLSAPSRHPSGKRLLDIADLVLDNLAEPGDACVEVEGLGQRMGPTSGVVGIAIVHALTMETVQLLIQEGIPAPVFVAANLPGGDEHNQRLFEQYRDRVRYL